MNEKQKKRILLLHRDTLVGNIIPGVPVECKGQVKLFNPLHRAIISARIHFSRAIHTFHFAWTVIICFQITFFVTFTGIRLMIS